MGGINGAVGAVADEAQRAPGVSANDLPIERVDFRQKHPAAVKIIRRNPARRFADAPPVEVYVRRGSIFFYAVSKINNGIRRKRD